MNPSKTKLVPVLLSLYEPYFEEMKKGIKRYEFRKRYLDEPTLAFIYCPNSVKAVKGLVKFGKPITGTPEEIAAISERETGRGAEIAEYLKGKSKGYAIPVLSWEEMEPVFLEELRNTFEGFTAPQSYYRLDNKKELLVFLQSKRAHSSLPLSRFR